MTLPAFLFGCFFATLYGAAFHLWRGGNLGRFIFYLAFSWIGFWLGQYIAERMDWNFLSVGPLHLALASLFSFLFLGLGYWLSLINNERK